MSSKVLIQSRLALERLRAEILSGERAAGSRLNIAALAQAMGVTPGAVREALAMLEVESLAVSEPAHGYRVSPVSMEDLSELVRARIEVEKLCIAEAIRHGSLAWEGDVVASMHRLSRVVERDPDVSGRVNPAWVLAHDVFHRALVSGCPNRWLLRLRDTLYRHSERYRQFAVIKNTPERDILAEHKMLEIAVLNRDVGAAQEAMTVHLQRTAEVLQESPRIPAQEN